jgi:hypothetical protein
MSTNRSKDRSSLCSFTLSTAAAFEAKAPAHPYLRAFHAGRL